MTLSLTYDDALSRVQVTATGLTVIDAFGRTVSNGWGTSDSGHVWTTSGGAASDYLVDGARGKHTLTSVDVARNTVAGPDMTDVDATIGWQGVSALAVGNSITQGILIRWADSANYIWARIFRQPSNVVTINLVQVAAGGQTAISGFPTVSGVTSTSSILLRVQAVGTTLRARAWLNGTTEPSSWQVTVTASALTSGQVGLRTNLQAGNTNTLPVTLDFDTFSAVPTVTVERSTNQVNWTTVRGGQALVPAAGAISLDDYEFTPDVTNYYRIIGQTNSVTPVLDGVWLKSIARPFLNRKVTVVDWSDVERASRSGIFPIVGRSLPVAVTDLHGSRRWTLDVLAETAAEAEDLDLLISTGEVQFVHVPAAERVPGGYVALGDTTERRTARRSVRRVFSMALTAAAAPGPDVIPAIGTWQTVFNNYPTWADVLTAHPTWADVLQLAGSPADVVVP